MAAAALFPLWPFLSAKSQLPGWTGAAAWAAEAVAPHLSSQVPELSLLQNYCSSAQDTETKRNGTGACRTGFTAERSRDRQRPTE